MEVSNLGESVWSNAAKELQKDLETIGKTKLVERLNALEKNYQELVKEHRKYKRQAMKSFIAECKKQSINDSGAANPPRTNAWTVGDYVKIREPAPKKRKKNGKRKRKTNLGK